MDTKDYIESGIIESYVLGLTTAAETAEVETMANENSAVKQAILDVEILIEKQASEDAMQPPSHIKTNLNNILFAGSAAAEIVNLSNPVKADVAPVRNINASRYIAAASIVLLVISTALNFYFYSAFKNSTDKYQALLNETNTLQANNAAYKTRLDEMNQSFEIMQNANMVNITMKGVKGKEENIATVFWNKKTKEVYLLSSNMNKVPAGKQYQLWAIVDGKPVDAGMVGYDCAGLCKMKVIDHAEAFAITLEKQGGSPTPTLSDMFVMGKAS